MTVATISQRVADLDARIAPLAQQRDLLIGRLAALSNLELHDPSSLAEDWAEQLADIEETIHDLVRTRDELLEACWR